ncbi:unnamed protein product [Discosporangium mesarthrocarpum]
MAQRNIVVCMDGTGNEFGRNITNVVETYLLAQKDETQLVYYDPGVGTGGYLYDENAGTLKAAYDKATGTGVHKNVEQAYRFLMDTYEEGDRVYLFGFSRGAFSARSLAGMLHKIGLLPRDHQNQLEYASKYYLDRSYHDTAVAYRDKFCRHCPVHFVGVWDTVESTLLHEGAKFTDTRLNPEVKFAYHAVAIDERRKDFPVCLWDETDLSPGQTMQQVWFAGVHSDVGGWYDERDLSSIALTWMAKKAMGAGMRIDADELARVEAQRKPVGTIHKSYTGFWKFRGSRRRKVPAGASIHRSVVERMEAVEKYTPDLPPDKTIVD